jgi:hypothetical protein
VNKQTDHELLTFFDDYFIAYIRIIYFEKLNYMTVLQADDPRVVKINLKIHLVLDATSDGNFCFIFFEKLYFPLPINYEISEAFFLFIFF